MREEIGAAATGAMRLALQGLVVGRGNRVLAGPLDLVLHPGELLAVTGENGAGKSTLLRILAGLLPLPAGRILVEGMVAPDGEPARRLSETAHYLGHRHAMKPGVSVVSNLRFWRRYLGAPALSPEAALARVGLRHAGPLPFSDLSAGQQRRAAIARLLVAHRPVWLLDEPTAALDATSQALFADILREHLAGGGIAVAATHQPLGVAGRELRLAAPALAAPDEAALAAAEGWL